MEEIKTHISDYLKEHIKVDDYDINKLCLGQYMDSIDIVELVIDLEKTYNIDFNDDWFDWGKITVDEIVECTNRKLQNKD
jgi:acyl carrier protein